MNRKRGRTAYSDEFRREAVRLVESGKGDVVQVAKDLGMHPQSLRNWLRMAARQRAGAPTPSRVLQRAARTTSLSASICADSGSRYPIPSHLMQQKICFP